MNRKHTIDLMVEIMLDVFECSSQWLMVQLED